MAAFSIPRLFFPQSVTAGQTFLIEIKKWDEPDSAYVVVEAAAVADANGNFSPAPTVYGLDPNTLYYVRTSNNCQSPRNYYIQEKMSGENSDPVFSATPSGFLMGNSYTLYISGWVSDNDGDPIIISSNNLPSFASLSQYDFGGVRAFIVECTPSGSGDNGNYSFTLIANDGEVQVSKEFTLTVDGTARRHVITPPSPDPLVVDIGDTSTKSYPTTGSGGSFTTTIYQTSSDFLIENGWIVTLSLPNISLFPDFIAGNTGSALVWYGYGANENEIIGSLLLRVQVVNP